MSRRVTSDTPAAAPIWACVGNSPISRVGTAIRATDAVSALLRPSRSPTWPKSTPPSGRARKPAANAPKAASVDETGSSAGKKLAPIATAK
jgi:hypothetical protein